ncbi:hypothetical protein [Parasitella parasitica]|uniref:RNA-directed DNA polymerase n=1 Tax=Parasitella parasitica TaxID=35722 RepID=A0A0B7MRU1_9FUNG|nr:hypothetical protein [Parasitella parasitica]
MEANLILDTGCTPCIISLQLAKRLGLESQLVALSNNQAGILVGDGRQVKTQGVLKDLEIELLPGTSLKVDALCLDVPEHAYEFLFGRIAIARIGINADLATSNWYVRDGDNFEPLEVSHSDKPKSSCFLVTMGPELPPSSESADSSKDMFVMLFASIYANETLHQVQKDEVKTLILAKSAAFGIGYDDLTQTNLVKFHVDTGDAKPVYKRPYPNMSFSELETLKQEIEDMLKAGTLIPAMHSGAEARNSGWSFQVMYVPKKNGEKRLVTMFQDLNKVTVPDPWPLPNITNLLEAFGGCQYLSSLDLLKGFHQIACDDDTIPKLQITTPFGSYCYTVMPFGVRNGPSIFARAIYLALKDFPLCATYIDDNQVFSETYQDHLKHLKLVFDRMIEVNMKLNPNKCNLFRNSLEFLGFEISTTGIAPIRSKVDAILSAEPPKDKSGVRAFINMVGFYRRHVHHFAQLTVAMNSLLKKNVPFEWREEHQREFDLIRKGIADAALLRYPDPRKPYSVYCDACDYGIAAVLRQQGDDGVDEPICFISRKLKQAEVNYPTVEKELLAVVYALFKLRRYLLDQEFVVYTDTMTVKYLFSKKEPNTRLQRWCLALKEYSFKVIHVPGTRNPADLISRYPLPGIQEVNGDDMLEQIFDAHYVQGVISILSHKVSYKGLTF